MTEQDKPFEVTPEFLEQVHADNKRNNQIGEDGIPEEVFSDQTGSETDEKVDGIIESVRLRREKIGKSAGQTICGDCAEVIPCQHVGIDRNGNRYTRGN